MRKKRWIRRLATSALFLAVVLPLLAFGLSNLYLLSPKGREKIASVVSQRLGLDSSVEGATWSPWNGITLYGLRVEQPGPLRGAIPNPLLRVESIRVDPIWSMILKKRLQVRGMDIVKSELTLPIELLSQLPSKPDMPEVASKIPEIAALPAAEKPTPQPLAGIPLAPVTPMAPSDTAEDIPTPPVMAETEATAPDPTVASVPEITEPTVWIHFKDARLSIVTTLADKPLYQISDIDGALPLGGKAADTKLIFHDVRSLGNVLAEEMEIPLKWHAPTLGFGIVEGKIFGITCALQGHLQFTPGIPFQINAVLPKQEKKEIQLSEKIGAEIAAVAGQGRFQGYAEVPATWQGKLVTQVLGVAAEYSDQKAEFNHGQVLVIFRNGALSCIDARLIGENLSVLGNATLLTDGRAAANARVVAPPETLVAISKFTGQDSAAPHLTPLSTPQRAALDMRIFGRLGDFHFKSDPLAESVPLQ